MQSEKAQYSMFVTPSPITPSDARFGQPQKAAPILVTPGATVNPVTSLSFLNDFEPS